MIAQRQIEDFLQEDEKILVDSIGQIVREVNASAVHAGEQSPKVAAVLRAVSRAIIECAFELDEEELKIYFETE